MKSVSLIGLVVSVTAGLKKRERGASFKVFHGDPVTPVSKKQKTRSCQAALNFWRRASSCDSKSSCDAGGSNCSSIGMAKLLVYLALSWCDGDGCIQTHGAFRHRVVERRKKQFAFRNTGQLTEALPAPGKEPDIVVARFCICEEPACHRG